MISILTRSTVCAPGRQRGADGCRFAQFLGVSNNIYGNGERAFRTPLSVNVPFSVVYPSVC